MGCQEVPSAELPTSLTFGRCESCDVIRTHKALAVLWWLRGCTACTAACWRQTSIAVCLHRFHTPRRCRLHCHGAMAAPADPASAQQPSSSPAAASSLLDRARATFYRIPYRWRFMGTVQLVGAAFILTIMSTTRDNHRTTQQQQYSQLASTRSSHSAAARSTASQSPSQ